MSNYTTTLRMLCEGFAGSKTLSGYAATQNIINTAIPYIFQFNFPIFDEEYRSVLETKIIKHYYFYEIGFETPFRFIFELDTKLNEIMPYYNKLYQSALDLEAKPLFENTYYTRDYTKIDDGTKTRTGNSHNEGTSDMDNTRTDDTTVTGEIHNNKDEKNRYSDTPQNGLRQIDGNLTEINDEVWLTDYRHINDTGSQNSTDHTDATVTDVGNVHTTADTANYRNDDIDNTQTYLEHLSGKQGVKTYAEMIGKLREQFLRIDEAIIKELRDLFMMVL